MYLEGAENWIDLAHDREKCESGTEPSDSIICEKFLEWLLQDDSDGWS